MRDYLLFIDTEGTGWPKNWNAPYSKKKNWPYCIQISWLIYNKNLEQIKEQSHYINGDFVIESSAYKIHGITSEFLKEQGEQREDVMTLLANDILQYQPMLIGHFIELDMHMISADFYRSGINNPSVGLPVFCTMKASASYAKTPERKYLRLAELYRVLFNKEQPGQHNALSDSKAAAACFFELVKIGAINDSIIEEQQEKGIIKQEQKKASIFTVLSIVLLIIIITTLIICLSWIHW